MSGRREQAARAALGRSLPTWLAIAAAIAMAVVSAYAIARIYDRASAHREAEVAVARAEAGAQALAGGARRAGLAAALRRLRAIERPIAGTMESIAAGERLLSAGDRGGAGELLRRLAELRGRYASAAATAKEQADEAALYAFLAGALLLGLLTAKLQSTRRAGAVAAARERGLRESEEWFRALVQGSSGVTMVADEDSTIRYVAPSSKRVLGYETERLAGTRLADITHPDESPAMLAACAARAAGVAEWRLRHRDGHYLHVEAAIDQAPSDADVQGLILNLRDVSERKALEAQLRHQALHDSLTGLPNRALFDDRAEHALARQRREGRSIAVLLLDLDDFKTVNDAFGHAAGDKLLREAALRVATALRAADTAARIGGDEFAVLLEDVDDGSPAQVADRILERLATPVAIDSRELFVRASVGIAVTGSYADDVDALLRNADVALYTAKRRGKGRREHFEPTMHASALRRLRLKADLEWALERGHLLLHYQPIVRLDDRSVEDVEALLRWRHPEHGMVAPVDFIPLAEETGLIVPIGEWVLREACTQLVRWQEESGARKLGMSVNLSARQLQDPGFGELVGSVLADSGLRPERLVLEVTESVLVHGLDSAGSALEQLSRLGVRIALDDFGTGYSSLSYLQGLPIDILKIDRSFIRRLDQPGTSTALVRAITALAEALELEVIAEGVEEEEQIPPLRSLRCEHAQGYLFARPAEPDAIAAMLRPGTGATVTASGEAA